ncbi:TRAP transporter small permease [Oceanobacillus oncorhynchi]|uniref:TRAP transporter small permease n=1 Tax=Oceanobacillus oncorhynchi TaxID=545501 RepID=UPI0034D4CFBE
MKGKYSFEAVISAAILIIIIVVLFLEIILRYFLGASLIWGEELSIYLFVWFVYISMSYAIMADSHIKVDSLSNLVPKKYRIYFTQIGILIWIVFSCIFVYFTFNYALDTMHQERVSVATGLPLWLVYAGIPLGFLLTIVRLIVEFINNFKVLKRSGE